MYKIEIKLNGDFVNNFHHGSIYDLVFIDLEFWPDYVNGKAMQKIYGYTLTRIIRASKQQYIKIKFLEFKREEKQLVNEIVQDIYTLKNKIFLGFNIKGSDLVTLRNRLKFFSIESSLFEIKLFDLRTLANKNKIKYKGLNGLFKHLDIKVNTKIDGSYFRKNPQKVFYRKRGWIDILLNMFEYCLEDAAGYFEIVANWQKKIPLLTKEMVEIVSLGCSPQQEKSDELEDIWMMLKEEHRKIILNYLFNPTSYEEIGEFWDNHHSLDEYWE